MKKVIGILPPSRKSELCTEIVKSSRNPKSNKKRQKSTNFSLLHPCDFPLAISPLESFFPACRHSLHATPPHFSPFPSVGPPSQNRSCPTNLTGAVSRHLSHHHRLCFLVVICFPCRRARLLALVSCLYQVPPQEQSRAHASPPSNARKSNSWWEDSWLLQQHHLT